MEDHLDTVWTDKELLTYAHPEKPLVTKKKINLNTLIQITFWLQWLSKKSLKILLQTN